jgi:hypothetical protein
MSTLKADTIVAADGSSPVTLTKQIAIKAYLVYDFTDDGTPDSMNISSVTDRATGALYGSFTNSLSANTYAVTDCSSPVQEGSMITTNSNRYGVASGDTSGRFSANYYQVQTHSDPQDCPYTSSLIVGDLA